MARSNIKEIMQKVYSVSKILVVRLKPPLGGEARVFFFFVVFVCLCSKFAAGFALPLRSDSFLYAPNLSEAP